jgi:hypothetical protein
MVVLGVGLVLVIKRFYVGNATSNVLLSGSDQSGGVQ